MEKATENDTIIFRIGLVAVPTMLLMMVVGYCLTTH